MIKKYLLQKELDYYINKEQDLKLVRYNKNLINNLFNKYSYFGMTENSYCCYGEAKCCWQEPIEEGIWDLTLNDVKDRIREAIRQMKKYLYNEPRIYIYDNDEFCVVYIYMRDRWQVDYHIWFSNKDI